jgi:two-component system cell cycle sensor histidine kinase/response regulator CckA
MEALPVGVALFDSQGGDVQSNAEYERIWGSGRPEVRSVSDYPAYKAWWVDTGRPLQPEEWASARASLHGEVVTGQYLEIQRFDGTRAIVMNSAAPVLDGKGQVNGSAVAIMDVTALRRAEEALRDSEERLSLALTAAQEGVWDMNLETGAVFYSSRWAQMLGYTEAETEPNMDAWDRLLHPDDRTRVREQVEGALRGERGFEAEFRLRHKDGHYVHILSRAFPVRREENGPIVRVVGTHLDLTARKEAEERIRQQNALLDGINRILRMALTCDTDEELGRACLAAAEELTGSRFGFIAEFDAEGRLDAMALSDPSYQACRMGRQKMPLNFAVRGLFGKVVLDGKSFYTNDPASHPDSAGTPQGHLPIEAFLGVPLNHAGKTIGMIGLSNREGGYRPQDLEAMEAVAGVIVEVLMRRRAERAVRAGEERFRQAQKMESIGVLAGGVAHDFNNLLTSIMGNASLLREDIGADGLEKLDSVLQATEKAADLTRQLLAYAGKGQFVIESVNLSDVVREMTDLLRASIPKKVELRLELPRSLAGVQADRGQLQQIVMNLVTNAAEAVGTNRVGTVTARTRVQRVSEDDRVWDEVSGRPLAPGGYVCLEVQDTGCGMDEQTRARIFDPFFTTKFMGRGLGLAAVAGIVQAHEGAIEIETAPGLGATFRVFLPARAAPRRPRGKRRSPALHGAGTILVVDDEEIVLDVARHALEGFGYQVLTAKNGREAIEIFEANAGRISLVLLDLLMPVMGGDEVIGALQSRHSGLKVIVMSGHSQSQARKVFEGKGVSGFLEKPFTATRLAQEVKTVLRAGTKSRRNVRTGSPPA